MDSTQTEKAPAEPSRRRKWASNASKKLGIHRFRRTKTTQDQSIAARLPDEILCAIFDFLPTIRTTPLYCSVNDYCTDLKRLTLVCRSWYPVATSMLYRHIQIVDVYYLPRLIKQLKRKPHLRKLVKSLVLPARPGPRMPDFIQKLYCQVVNLLEDLRYLSIMAPMVENVKDSQTYQGHLSSPIATGKHSNLCSLSVYGDILATSSQPHLLFAPFSNLEYLALNYVYLSDFTFDFTSMEVLTRLRHFEFTGGTCVWLLDEWLQSCPNLEHLTLRCTSFIDAPSQPPMKLLTSDKLKTLDLLFLDKFSDSGPYSFAWLQECTSITHLTIDHDILTSVYEEGGRLHLGEELTLQLPFDYNGDFDTTVQFPFDTDPKEGCAAPSSSSTPSTPSTPSKNAPCAIKFQAQCRHQTWYRAHQSRIEECEKEGKFDFGFEVDICGCLDDGKDGVCRLLIQGALFIGVVKGWPVVRRLMDRETREMILWQFPGLKALVEP
ncbi:hypothetical protein FRC15_003055 [Serendipita sp. 397]|nr:hypothetical protein FRC15_003055 [Serendipita sp. 397]KAG8778867.1 hypothetical protein FRC16_003702 [Serendipita sp. 398]